MREHFTINKRLLSDIFAKHRSTFEAFCELLNNSLQAKAKTVWVTFTEPSGLGIAVRQLELLEPDPINAWAQAVIRTLKADEHQRGCLMEERILKGDLAYESSMPRRRQRRGTVCPGGHSRDAGGTRSVTAVADRQGKC